MALTGVTDVSKVPRDIILRTGAQSTAESSRSPSPRPRVHRKSQTQE
jgi:hypothetical protein